MNYVLYGTFIVNINKDLVSKYEQSTGKRVSAMLLENFLEKEGYSPESLPKNELMEFLNESLLEFVT